MHIHDCVWAIMSSRLWRKTYWTYCKMTAIWQTVFTTVFSSDKKFEFWLTHSSRVTHKCVSDLTSIGSDNGLSPGRRQAIIRTNAGILLIRPLGTNFSEFLVEILIFSFNKMRLKVLSAKRRPFCLGLNELRYQLSFLQRVQLTISQNWSR